MEPSKAAILLGASGPSRSARVPQTPKPGPPHSDPVQVHLVGPVFRFTLESERHSLLIASYTAFPAVHWGSVAGGGLRLQSNTRGTSLVRGLGCFRRAHACLELPPKP